MSSYINSITFIGKIIHILTTIVQYFLLTIITLLILEMLLSSKYQSSMLITVTIAGYTLNIAILGLFSKRLFSWYKMNRASVVVVLYAISFTIAALSSLVAAVEDSFLIAAKQDEVTQKAEVAFPSFGPDTLLHSLSEVYTTILEQCCITDEHPYQTLLLSIFLS